MCASDKLNTKRTDDMFTKYITGYLKNHLANLKLVSTNFQALCNSDSKYHLKNLIFVIFSQKY